MDLVSDCYHLHRRAVDGHDVRGNVVAINVNAGRVKHDLVFLARELLREPYWALKTQHELGGEPSWPIPYGYAVKRRT